MASNEIISYLNRDLVTLEDELNPQGSRINTIYPSTTLDQVFDQTSSTNKTLRMILDELNTKILSGGRGSIEFPVVSVNGKTGNVVLDKDDIDLDNVDNTADIDKPLSNPQREAVNDMLRNYHFNVDMSELYNHMMDNDNPHGITIQQLNYDQSVTAFVKELIFQHSNDTTLPTHRDIRDQLRELRNNVSDISTSLDAKIERTISSLAGHAEADYAHASLFEQKENLSNKVSSFVSGNNAEYPTTRAVVEYVGKKMAELHVTSGPNQWIDNIFVVDKRSDLPYANPDSHRQAYIIKYGVGSECELAICRSMADSSLSVSVFIDDDGCLIVEYDGLTPDIQLDESGYVILTYHGNYETKVERDLTCVGLEIADGVLMATLDDMYSFRNDTTAANTYYWDISPMGAISKFNPAYFTDTPDGMSINPQPIADAVLTSDTLLNILRANISEVFPEALSDYYTKSEIEDLNFVKSISIIPGTADGTLRYYINNDTGTMSSDIQITGLQRLAYLEYVTENELADQSVHSRHILNRAIEHRHMGDKAVGAENMRASYMTLFGNFEDSDGLAVQEVTMIQLAVVLAPLIARLLDGVNIQEISDQEIVEAVLKAYRKLYGWIDEHLAVNLFIDNTGCLILEYDGEMPDIHVDEEGNIILNIQGTEETDAEHDLTRLTFVVIDDMLIVILDDNALDKPARFRVNLNGELIIDYEDQYNAPEAFIAPNGEVLLTTYGSEADEELERWNFRISNNHELLVSYLEDGD